MSMIGFDRRRSFNELSKLNLIGLEGELDIDELERIKKIRRNWNFYKGYHWEEIPEGDKQEITFNYCRAFCDKFVAFEMGDSFTYSLGKATNAIITSDGRTQFKYLEDVWVDNNQFEFSTNMGLMKVVTGEAWVQVRHESPDELDDPYGEYPNGRVRVILMSSSVVFPYYDPQDKDKLLRLTIKYQYEKEQTTLFGKVKKKTVTYKQEWTKDKITITDDGETEEPINNPYGVIPFVCIKNLSVAGIEDEGRSDIEDIIPLNVEFNMKCSDISEIIDYHASPITVVFGAKIGSLEKGANKVWGGLPKDAKVENLSMDTDLAASNAYLATIKLAMCEISSIPEVCLGGTQAISNTSGVALQYMNLPLIEKVRMKKTLTENGLEEINKLILLISKIEGLIKIPETVEVIKKTSIVNELGETVETEEIVQEPLTSREFYFNEVELPDTLPKDLLLEMQQIQAEMTAGIEDRKGAMKRLGKENIDFLLSRIDKDRQEHPDVYGIVPPQLNSGMTNGETPVEVVRKEITGQNGLTA